MRQTLGKEKSNPQDQTNPLFKKKKIRERKLTTLPVRIVYVLSTEGDIETPPPKKKRENTKSFWNRAFLHLFSCLLLAQQFA